MSNRKKQKTNIFGSLLVGFLVVLVAYLYFLNTKAKASWFDDAWRYRVAVPISAHTTAETNVYITLSGSDGINTTDTTKFQTDCGDIRFVNEAGDLLPYYLTSACGLAQTGFQVYLESFPAGAQTIYYYYGNPSVPNGFSGASMGAAATGVTLGTRGSETEAPSSPMVYFRLDEGVGQTVANSMETVNNGTLGPDATVTGTDPTWRSAELCMVGKCLEFESTSSQYVNVANTIASVNSVSFWVKPTSTTTSLMVLNGAAGNASISVSSGTISAGAGFTSPTIYVNGKVSSALVANEWQYVTVTTATGISASNIMIGRVNTGYLDGFIDEVKLFGSTLSVSQIKAGYASGLAKSSSIKNSSVSFGGGSAAGTLANGLVGYWKMDESAWVRDCSTDTAIDSSGLGSHGDSCSGVSGPTTGIGKYGRAGVLDGVDDYVSIPDTSNLSFVSSVSQLSLGAWIYISSGSTGDRTIISKYDSFTPEIEYAFFLDATNNELNFWLSEDGTSANDKIWKTSTVDNVVTVNRWHYVVVTLNLYNDEVKYYVDGQPLVSENDQLVGIDNMVDTTEPVRVSAMRCGAGSVCNYWAGKLDEIRVYNRALSSVEVRNLYLSAPEPIAYWNFNENYGQTLSYGLSGASTLGLDSSITSTDPYWTTGKYGGALFFDGVDDTVRTDDSDLFSFGNSTYDIAYTMEAWVNMENGYGASRYIFEKSSEWLIRVGSDGRLICSQADSSTGGYIGRNWSGPVETGVWYHITCTYDGSGGSAGVKIYVNGVRVDNANEQSGTYVAMENLSNSFRISDGEYFRGKIDEARIYNYERNQMQILQDMQNGVKIPVSYWKLDEGFGTTANDTGYASNALTLSSAGWTNAGKFGKAYDGATNRRMTRSDDTDFDFANGSDDFSLSLWFNRGGVIANQEYLLDKHSTNDGYTLYMDADGDIVCGIGDGVSFPEDMVSTTDANYDDANWHHAVCVKMGTVGIYLYVDGKLVGSDASLGANGDMSNTGKIIIGDANETDGSDEWLGDIDDVKIYRAALTSEEVATEFSGINVVVLGALGTSATNMPNMSSNDSYCPPGQSIACTSPIGHWNLDENSFVDANDLSGNNNTLTLTNTPSWVSGKFGSGIKFSGNNQHLLRADDADFDFADDANMTLELWFKHDVASAQEVVLTKYSEAGYKIIMESDGDITCAMDYDSTWSPTDSVTSTDASYDDGRWHHVVCVKSAATSLSLYLDGVLVGTDSSISATNTLTNSDPLYIGIDADGISGDYTGAVDDIRIYTTARSSSEIAWDMNQGKPLGWWKMDEGVGTLINDAMGNSVAGTLMNTPTWVDGKLNSGITFAGSNQQILIADDPDFDFADDESMSLTAWFNHNTASAQEVVVSKYAAAGYKIIMESDGDITCGLDYDSTWTPTDSITSTLANYDDSNWHHIACIKNGATSLSLYIDGVLIGSDSSLTATNTLTNADPLYIGIDADGTSNDFTGTLDDIRVYRYPLTSSQVKSVMVGGSVKIGPSTGAPN